MNQFTAPQMLAAVAITGLSLALAGCQDNAQLAPQSGRSTEANARFGVESGTAIVSNSPKPD